MLPMVCAPSNKCKLIKNHEVNRYRLFYLLRQHQCGKLPPPAGCSNQRCFYIDQSAHMKERMRDMPPAAPASAHVNECMVSHIWRGGYWVCHLLPQLLPMSMNVWFKNGDVNGFYYINPLLHNNAVSRLWNIMYSKILWKMLHFPDYFQKYSKLNNFNISCFFFYCCLK